MTQNFDKLYTKIISEAKIRQNIEYIFQINHTNFRGRTIDKQTFTIDEKRLGFVCPVCGTESFSIKALNGIKQLVCKYFPRCHGRAPLIDVNSTDPADIAKLEQIKENTFNKIEQIKENAILEREKQEAKIKAQKEEFEAKRQAKISELKEKTLNHNKMVMSRIDGRTGSWNSSLDQYHTLHEVIQYVNTIGDTHIFNVFKREENYCHVADGIPYQRDFDILDEVAGTAESSISDPLIVMYQGKKYDIFCEFDSADPKNPGYHDYFQPSTYGT